MIQITLKQATNLKTKESLYVKIPYSMELIAKIKTLSKRYYVPTTKEWEVPTSDINNVIALFGAEELEIIGKAHTKGKAEEASAIFDGVDTISYRFKTEPFNHQIEGFNYGLAHNKFILGDEQGLGKTKQAIDIAIARKSLFKHCLIVAGVNGLKWNWVNEIGTHSNEKAHLIGSTIKAGGKVVIGSVKERLADLNVAHNEFFLVTNIETLRDEEICSKLEQMCKKGIIGMVIIDEIHKAKNSTSQQGKAIHSLKSFYKMALTGTPLMNKPIDLYNPLKWIDVEQHSLYSFKNHYCVMGGYGGYEIVGYKNLSQLREILDANMLRRKKDEVLDLPPKVKITEYVEMTPKQAQLYKDVKNAIKANIDQIKFSHNPLAQLIRLRQATGFTGILSSTISESAKLDRMEELVEEAVENGEKVLIFSNWTSVTNEAEKRLAQYNPAIITGEINEPMAEKDRFQNDPTCKVIIGTIGAMGTGYTLTSGTTEIFLDSPWNQATKDQAEDRAHRIGTKGTVNIITLVCKDTIDERIEEIVYEKGALSDMLVDGVIREGKRVEIVDWLLS